jgi:hypothetical protein
MWERSGGRDKGKMAFLTTWPIPRLYRGGAANELHRPPSHPNIITNSTSTFAPRHNSTNMEPILDAIAAINAHEAGDKHSYRQTAKRFGVDRTTLARRHQGKTRSHAGEAQQRMLLSPQ